MARDGDSRSLKLDGVAARFRQCRKRRQDKTAVPNELWVAAAQVERRDGIDRRKPL